MSKFVNLLPRKGPSKPIPLVPEDGLHVFDRGLFLSAQCFQTPSPVIRKFVRCFQKAWIQIPNDDRNTLKDYWRPKRVVETDYRSPTITLQDGFRQRGIVAACCWGHTLEFDIYYVDRAKPTELTHVIAHELGHAISFPHGWNRQHECKAHGGEECVACECRAFSYMAAWGFDPFREYLPKGRRLAERFTKNVL